MSMADRRTRFEGDLRQKRFDFGRSGKAGLSPPYAKLRRVGPGPPLCAKASRLWLCIAAVIWSATGVEALASASAPRSRIPSPGGCSFSAHDGEYQTLAEVCADTLRSLDRVMTTSARRVECQDWPNLEAVTSGGGFAHDGMGAVEFLPLSRGRFLLKIRCSGGAYNESFLLFAYDESIRVRLLLDAGGTQAPPPILLFPEVVGSGPTGGLTGKVFVRHFDRKRLVLYHWAKALGDGSGGVYAEYLVDKIRFVPSMRVAVYKGDADYADPYQFQPGRRPSGKDWRALRPESPLEGRVAEVWDDGMEPDG